MKLKFMYFFLPLVAGIIFSPKAEGQMSLREVGIRTSDFKSVTAIYKKEKAPNVFIRYRFAFANFQYAASKERDNVFNTAIGFAVGKERRKELTDRLDFFHGWEPSARLYLSASKNDISLSVRPTLGYVLGVQFEIADHFLLAMETIPSIVGNISTYNTDRMLTLNAGFNSNAVSMTLAYQFEKK